MSGISVRELWLSGRIGAHDTLKKVFQTYIRKMGSLIMLDEEKVREESTEVYFCTQRSLGAGIQFVS